MNIDSIRSGIVIDHIQAGNAMKIYEYLNLQSLNCSVAIIKNVRSTKMGRKDIIKVDEQIELNLDVLGYIDPNITVNVIVDGKLVSKKHLSLPQRIEGVIRCKNPRCITTTEPGLTQAFRLTDETSKTYRCIYCDAEK
jgi:aspartate carbamoyltransferase regulatory subunit